MSSVSILCRGKSLKEIDKLPVCDTLILVNSFQNELDDVNIAGVTTFVGLTTVTNADAFHAKQLNIFTPYRNPPRFLNGDTLAFALGQDKEQSPLRGLRR